MAENGGTLPYRTYVPHSKRTSVDISATNAANVFTRPGHSRAQSSSPKSTPQKQYQPHHQHSRSHSNIIQLNSNKTPPPAPQSSSSSAPSPPPPKRNASLPPPPPDQIAASTTIPSTTHSALSSPGGSQTSSTSSTPAPIRASYRPGFQPPGVYRHRTFEFVKIREGSGGASSGSNNGRLHDIRILRRLDKLVSLHFPFPSTSTASTTDNQNQIKPSTSTSSLAMDAISGLVTRVRNGKQTPLTSSSSIKAQEQAIVKWVDDSTVTECAICNSSFSLTVRKHHCRLCGNVVCFLPPLAPRVPRRCSTFIKYEWDDFRFKDESSMEKERTGQVVEIDIESLIAQGTPPSAVGQGGVRICVSCLSIIFRQQLRTRSTPLPLCLRLHSALTNLQAEIESSLPHLQTLLLSPDAQSSPLVLLNARKAVMTRLASHDALAKRIRDLTPATPDEERLQRAMALAAQTWLSEKMALLKGIGSFQNFQVDGTSSNGRSSDNTTNNDNNNNNNNNNYKIKRPSSAASSTPKSQQDIQKDRDRAARLAVLLEQEKIVAGYFEEAKAKRQFEDSVSLQTSLDELRAEIDKIKNESG